MTHLTHADAATILREAVAALSDRLTTEYGELVPDASAQRTSAVVAKLEAGGASPLSDDDVTTLDSWIRLADSAMLHGDTREAERRVEIGDRLRAVRALVVPGTDRLLTEDPREQQAPG
jgi:hypothetical protein